MVFCSHHGMVQLVKERICSSSFAALSIPDSKKVPISCCIDGASFLFVGSLVGSVQYTCPVVPLCIVDASLSHYVGN